MGKKVHPLGFRLGGIQPWLTISPPVDDKTYAHHTVENEKITQYIYKLRPEAVPSIAKIGIERAGEKSIFTIHTSKPGLLAGQLGVGLEQLKQALKKKFAKQDLNVKLLEIKIPELNATLVGKELAGEIKSKTSSPTRAALNAISAAMRYGAKGIKIQIKGRPGGREIASMQVFKEGRVPLHTLRADIDYALAEANTMYGKVGIKVWIFKGEVYGKRDLSPNIEALALESTKRFPGPGARNREQQ